MSGYAFPLPSVEYGLGEEHSQRQPGPQNKSGGLSNGGVQKADRKHVVGRICVHMSVGGALWMLGVVSMINVMILIIHLLITSFFHSTIEPTKFKTPRNYPVSHIPGLLLLPLLELLENVGLCSPYLAAQPTVMKCQGLKTYLESAPSLGVCFDIRRLC